MHKEHHAFLYGILAAFSSAAMAVFFKLSSSIPGTTIAFVRFAICLPFVLWMMKVRKVRISIKKIPGHLVRGLAGLATLYAYVYAVQNLPLVDAVTLSNTTPLFIPLIVLVWLKLVVSKMRVWALGLGFLGVLVVLRPTSDLFHLASIAGLAAGFSGAIALFGVRQLSKIESTDTILAYYFTICFFVTLIPALIFWEPIEDPVQWVYFLGMGLCSLLYQLMVTKSYTHAPATKVSVLNYLNVVFGGLSGWLIFGEVPDLWAVVGTLLIIGGALLALFDQTPAREIKKS